MKRYYLSFASVLYLLVYLVACETATGPNDIGGETKLELTEVGGKFPIYIGTEPYTPALEKFQDSTIITKNDNGMVTFFHYSTFDSVFARALDTALGLQVIPSSLKLTVMSSYLKKFGATLDTTNKAKMSIRAEFKARITSEGIQEYFSNASEAHTLVKYDWSVGNVYEFTNSDGIKVKRTVASKSTTDDYVLGFFKVKVIQVEETKEDPLIEKITYIANHKFGLVGVLVKTKNGKQTELSIFPPNL
ncbi:MAG: hypothetical protein U0264_17035 [Candidatus Kapaibacterium sp.]